MILDETVNSVTVELHGIDKWRLALIQRMFIAQ